jgi:hypothetical protein
MPKLTSNATKTKGLPNSIKDRNNNEDMIILKCVVLVSFFKLRLTVITNINHSYQLNQKYVLGSAQRFFGLCLFSFLS